MKYTQDVKFIIEKLSSFGHEAYIVGGCVRDMLLGIEPKDYDICTSALPEQVIMCFEGLNVIPTGIAHGTVTLILNEKPYEITTFRTESGYSDNRRPDKVSFVSDIKEDLARRDFTINAMAYSDKTGLIDYFNGQEHIKKKLICTPLDADVKFREDALRIMRALRFSAVYGFEIEEKTTAAIMRNKHLLNNIASERIQSELKSLLLGKNVRNVLIDFAEVLAVIIPQIIPCIGFAQHNPYHKYDVWRHTVEAISASEPILEVRLALLFHDLGKPETFTLDEKGIGHFYNHGAVSTKIAQNELKRIRFDNKTINSVLALIKYHNSEINVSTKSVKRWLNKLGEEDLINLIYVKMGDNSTLAKNITKEREDYYNEVIEIINSTLASEQCFGLSMLKISGDDLIKLKIPQGKKIGLILKQVLEKVLDETLENDKNVLIDYVKNTYIGKK